MSDQLFLGIATFVFGLILGPWLGIAVDRVVDRVGFKPEHRCVRCEQPQGIASLIPIASWFRKCSGCNASVGLRYPLVDLATAVTFCAMAYRFGSVAVLVPYLGFAAVLIVLSAIDVETHLLPNVIVWPSVLTALFLIFVMSGQLNYPEGISSALLGGAVFGGFIGLAHVIYEPGMGRGDVKLSLLLGLFLGWIQPDLIEATRLVLLTIIGALLGGGLIGLAYNKIRRLGRAEIPFGPALAVATVISVIVSPQLADAVSY